MTMMRSWMTSQTNTATTATTSRTRHDHAPAITMPRGTDGSGAHPAGALGSVTFAAAPRGSLLRRIMRSV